MYVHQSPSLRSFFWTIGLSPFLKPFSLKEKKSIRVVLNFLGYF